MKMFRVLVREVHIQPYLIAAEDAADAIQKVEDCQGKVQEAGFEFSHSLGPEFWTVEEENN